MKKTIWIIVIVVIVVIASVGIYKIKWTENAGQACTTEAKICPDGTAVGRSGPNCEFAPCPTGASSENASIKNVSVKAGDTVASTLEITGEAVGTWYFEASFPVKIYDANGKLLGSVPAQAQSDWMTENFVPFKATLTFETSTTGSGTLVLQNDNPSGRPESAKQIEIPIHFKSSK